MNTHVVVTSYYIFAVKSYWWLNQRRFHNFQYYQWENNATMGVHRGRGKETLPTLPIESKCRYVNHINSKYLMSKKKAHTINICINLPPPLPLEKIYIGANECDWCVDIEFKRQFCIKIKNLKTYKYPISTNFFFLILVKVLILYLQSNFGTPFEAELQDLCRVKIISISKNYHKIKVSPTANLGFSISK